MMPLLSLSTKSKTLQDLSLLVKESRVLPVVSFHVRDVRDDLQKIIDQIQKQITDAYLVIRSSARSEDNLLTSNAGHFCSVLFVPQNDRQEIEGALFRVIDSYGDCADDEELFVQPMLEEISIAGVVFTADVDTLAPYYVINYDDSGKSDSITSGRSTSGTTYIHFKYAPIPPADPLLELLCKACREIEGLTENRCLDIEFAVSRGEVYIFQVRPIISQGKDDLSALDLRDSLFKIHRKVEKLSFPHPNLMGDKVIFGVMPDWNPAEIIGLRPRQLALSLYKELVTDNVWAYQRDNYGYRNLRSHPLLVSLLGIPYIDVRVDFNSFIPKSLDEHVASKLVDYYIAKLDSSPHLHDKIEFEIVHSCYYPTLSEKLELLREHGFNSIELMQIEKSLLDLTNKIVDPENGLYKNDLQKVAKLAPLHASILKSDLTVIEKIYWLVEYCKRYGTLPFAGVARAAFIAVQLLGSFVEVGIMSREEQAHFLNSLNTVTKQLQNKLSIIGSKEYSCDDFIAEFGHLRPGTYDILSPCYKEGFNQYFSSLLKKEANETSFTFSVRQKEGIQSLLNEKGVVGTPDSVISFIVESIEGREYAKLLFTRTLSDVLELISELGKKYDISLDCLSHLNIKFLLNLYASLDHRNLNDILMSDILINQELHVYTRAIKMPSLIRKPSDVYSFFLDQESPNFITLGRVVAETVKEEQILTESLAGKIVLVRAADPGYDFLFTRQISGLVTQFGGANSHMAIRCSELGIPAVIGAGEKNYAEWSKSQVLEIDCANQLVRTIQ